MGPRAKRVFELILVKPSHYDDDGYVIQWLRSVIPSNTLAVLHGLARDSAARHVLGPDGELRITTIDETHARVRPHALARKIRCAGGQGLVAMVGVQTNQFPRAIDIARPLRAAGVNVVIGGFHVSGCLAMLPEMEPGLQQALDMGVSLFAGEAETRLDRVLQDAAAGKLQPIYDFMRELPDMAGAPSPYMARNDLRRNLTLLASFDAGRGCPFQCSFCTIINVQGRKSRHRSADDVEAIIREHAAQGIERFFITDDNFARNKNWEAIFDRIIALREHPAFRPIRFTIQIDTQAHRIPNFVEKAGRANVFNAFIGLENINADNLLAAKKRQNKIADYRALILALKRAGILTTAGYILGFPADTPESIRRDVEIIKRELPLDILEFFCLTPLPGSEDHQKLAAAGVAMDADLNRYDLDHVVTAHPTMSRDEWEAAYRAAWEAFYTPDHIVTAMRRAEAAGMHYRRVHEGMVFFHHCIAHEGVHPLEGGLLRIRRRRDRRPHFSREHPLLFYPKHWANSLGGLARLLLTYWRFERLGAAIARDPRKHAYVDKALLPVASDDDETFEMLSGTEVARTAVAHHRKVQRLTARAEA